MKGKNKIILSNHAFFENTRKALDEGKSVIFTVKGKSMCPFLKEQEQVVLQPFQPTEIKRGIVVLAKEKNKIVLHRVIRYNKEKIWLAGDANLALHEIVVYDDVLAVAARVYRTEKPIELLCKRQRFFGLAWYYARPFRRARKKWCS